MTKDELVRQLVSEFGSDERARIEEFVASLSDRQVAMYAQAGPGSLGTDFNRHLDRKEATTSRVARATGQTEEAASRQVQETEARQQAIDRANAEGDFGLLAYLAGGQTSQWIQDRTKGRPLDQATKDDILADYNLARPEAAVETWAEFEMAVDTNDPTARQAFLRNFAGSGEAFRRVMTGDGYRLVREDHWRVASETFAGVENRNMLARIVNVANMAGVSKEEDSEWVWVAALAQAHGVLRDANRAPAGPRKPTTPEGKAAEGVRQAASDAFAKVTGGRSRATQEDLTQRARDQWKNEGVPTFRLMRLTDSWKAAQVRYGDPALALIATVDRDLAESIYENGEASAEEAQKVNQILGRAGVSPERLEAMGVYADPMKWAAMTQPLAMTRSRQPRVASVTLPDPEAVRQSMKSMWNSWFGRDPSADEVARFRGSVESAMRAEGSSRLAQQPGGGKANPFKGQFPDAGPDVLVTDEDVNVEARKRSLAQSLPEYQRLFGRKDTGITEEEYMAQFDMAAASLFGSSHALGFREKSAGMMSGNIQTTLGQLAGSAQAMENSTFRQRMARAAEVFARNT